ncbi:MAG: isoprenylcysteine carboxylmethyltransferase family protein [Anaerolineae bacterium]|nr:isoprenylcysteine carboxylmethyltransferase family protein [Anaerolineae bacterium]
MELFSELKLGWLNGWIFLGLLCLIDGICFLVFPKAVVKRLFDRSGWSQKQVVFTVIGKVCALVCLFLLIFTPLKIGNAIFILGAGVAALGLIGLAIALFNYRNTPFGEPVTRGLYKISRHPQIVMASVVLLGACIAIGSWSAVIALTIARILSHFGILAEEEICLKQYGDSYQTYMQRVPRYFVFF